MKAVRLALETLYSCEVAGCAPSETYFQVFVYGQVHQMVRLFLKYKTDQCLFVRDNVEKSLEKVALCSLFLVEELGDTVCVFV